MNFKYAVYDKFIYHVAILAQVYAWLRLQMTSTIASTPMAFKCALVPGRVRIDLTIEPSPVMYIEEPIAAEDYIRNRDNGVVTYALRSTHATATNADTRVAK